MENFNWPVVGQPKIVKYLQKNISSGKLAHAYLFSGTEHLGKHFVASKFINSVLCADYHKNIGAEVDVLPCGKCPFCRQIAKGIHPDIYFLKKEEDKKNISVEQVRELRNSFSLASFLNSYKIALIENAEIMSESAQNALLKLLEEPKGKTILILMAYDDKLLLPTIVSRCQVLKFYPAKSHEIFDHLIALGANRSEAKQYAALAHGQAGLAINFYHNPELFNEYLNKIDGFLGLFNASLAGRFKFIEQLISGEEDTVGLLSHELDSWLLVLRDVLALQNNSQDILTNLYFEDKLAQLAGSYSANYILRIMAKIKKIKQYLGYNINPRLAMENLALDF